MFSMLKRELKKSLKYSIDSLKFRWHVIKQGGYAAKSLIVTNQQYIHIGRKIKIKKGYRIECYSRFAGIKMPPPSLTLFDKVLIGYNFTALVANKVQIGSNTILASNVSLISENHGIYVETNVPFYAQPLQTGPIIIGEGCWIGQNVIVLPNVNIGDKCVIGANSVVTNDIPSYSIAVGMPAKVIKRYNFELHSWIKV